MEILEESAGKEREYLLDRLLRKIEIDPLSVRYKDNRDYHGEELGSEVIYTSFSNFKEVRVISLYRPFKKTSRSSCISISFGCVKRCPICKSGTEEVFRGHYNYKTIVAMQELLMRCSNYYGNEFWLHKLPFSIALTGQGDISFNFEESMKAMEIIQSVFDRRFMCNVSTSFVCGVKKLLEYANNKRFVLNLQVSIHGHNKEIRKLHVDSDEDPQELVFYGLEYARKTNTTLIVNYGLTDKNFKKEYLSEVINWLDPGRSRIKFSRMNLPEKSGLYPMENNDFFKLAVSWAVEQGKNYEIFNENYQAGLDNGAACGTIINQIPLFLKLE